MAVPCACDVIDRVGYSAPALYVSDAGRPPRLWLGHGHLRRDALDKAQEVIAEVRHALEPHVQSVAARIHEGSPGPLIVEMAMACRGDLVVVGCRGSGAIKTFSWGVASTYVARSGHCSVLLAKRPPSGERRFLLALDGSAHARAALQWLADLDLSPEDRIQVVTVLESPEASPGEQVMKRQRAAEATALPDRFETGTSAEEDVLAEARQRLGARRLRVTVTARRGHAASEILAAAREFGAQWLVLGAKGQQSPPDSALGAVARKVVSRAPARQLSFGPEVLACRDPRVPARGTAYRV